MLPDPTSPAVRGVEAKLARAAVERPEVFACPPDVHEADAEWFAANPGRRYRLRPATAAELAEAGFPEARDGISEAAVIVNRVAEGLHGRAGCRLRGCPPRDDDEALAAMFALAVRGRRAVVLAGEPIDADLFEPAASGAA